MLRRTVYVVLVLSVVSTCGAEMVAQWKFDEGGGGSAGDSVGGFDGTLRNMDEADWVDGMVAGGLEFDGVDDYVELPGLNLNSNTLTITTWLKAAGTQSSYAGVVFRRTGNEDASGLNFASQNKLGYHWQGNRWDWDSGLAVPSGQWVFVALVIDATATTIYLGDPTTGVLSSATDSHGGATEQFNGANIGRDAYQEGGRFFTGVLDEVSIWDEALSVDAVTDVFEGAGAAQSKAFGPRPRNTAENIVPGSILNWSAGQDAVSHNVYFGTDESGVANATEASSEFKGNQPGDTNSYDPGALEFGRIYYWRIDEVNDVNPDVPAEGAVWSFTTHDGKATILEPADGKGWVNPDGVTLTWTAAPQAVSHDMYFGAGEVAVGNATQLSCLYQGSQPESGFALGALAEGVTYFWRIDEVGSGRTVKGDVWSFTTTDIGGGVNLRVDMGLINYESRTVKQGWAPWVQPRWHDMYGHDCVLANGTGEEASCGEAFDDKPGLGGTGVMAGMTCVYEGRGGLIAAGLEMCNLNATCGPPAVSGEVLYDPICNTWFQVTDYAGVPGANILLALYNLPPGEYTLKSYHNRFGGERNGGSPHWECICNPQPPMSAIIVGAIAAAETLFQDYGSDYEPAKLKGNYDLGDPDGVEMLEGAQNVEIQQVTSDEQLVPSIVRFRTNGSAVLVVYEGNCCEYVPDDIRPQRESQRAILNAFELISVGSPPEDFDDDGVPDTQDNCVDVPNADQGDCNCNDLGDACDDEPCGPTGCGCPGDLNGDDQRDLDDLQALAQVLLQAGSPFIAPIPPAPACAELTGDDQADLDDLQAVAGILLSAGSPFIALCE